MLLDSLISLTYLLKMNARDSIQTTTSGESAGGSEGEVDARNSIQTTTSDHSEGEVIVNLSATARPHSVSDCSYLPGRIN